MFGTAHFFEIGPIKICTVNMFSCCVRPKLLTVTHTLTVTYDLFQMPDCLPTVFATFVRVIRMSHDDDDAAYTRWQ